MTTSRERADTFKTWISDSFDFDIAVTLAYNPSKEVSWYSPAYEHSGNPCHREFKDKSTAPLFTPVASRTTRSFSMNGIQHDLDKWHAFVDRRLLGNKFNRRRDQRSVYVGYVEHINDNAHVHLLWRTSVDRELSYLQTMLDAEWKRLASNGSTEVVDAHDRRGWADYAAKDIRTENDLERFVFSPMG